MCIITNPQKRSFCHARPGALEIGLPENFITYNYIATFLIENLSDSLEELTDREYTIEEVHSDDDGISKLTVLDPHR